MDSAPPSVQLPIGISDFRKLRAPGVVYVDKTDFIVQVLGSQREVVLFPRPRRFGKTVNLSSFRYFVEKSSEDRSALFEGLAVWGSAAARAHFQRYPVISVTFKDVKAKTFASALAAIQEEIRRAYGEHAYLLDAGNLRAEEAERFQQILRAEGPAQLYASSLRDLCTLLTRHHGERVVVLIDEYDSPIHAAGGPEDEREMLDFFRGLLSGALKDNPHLFKGVVTGILRIAKESLFSGLNNLAVYSLLRRECATAFGFTQEEVESLAAKTGCTAHLPDLEAWYNGYRFGGHVVYNPWSILSFLDSEDKVLRPYWVNTSSDDLLRRVVLEHGIGQDGELETLLQGGEIQKIITDQVALRDLRRSPEAVWSFLLFTGYLKAVDVREGLETVATLAIPNREVLSVYHTIFRTWLEQGVGGARQVDELLRSILSGDESEIERILGVLLSSLSVHDVARRRVPKTKKLSTPRSSSAKSRKSKRVEAAPAALDDTGVSLTPEQVYHVFVVSLLLGFQPRFTVRSNRESGRGRYDVMVLPKKSGDPGVVMELKVRNRKKRETMKSALSQALAQIRDRDHAADLRAAGATPIHEIGIVFDGKDVKVGVARRPRG